jgi:hypothetical protein
MVHFLKNKKNKTIIECESIDDDLFSSIYLINYTNYFLEYYNLDKEKANDFLLEMCDLDSIRNLWWESNYVNKNWRDIDHFIRDRYEKSSEKLGLIYSKKD